MANPVECNVTTGSTVTTPYKPTPAEAVAKDRYRERKARRPPARVKVFQRDGVNMTGTDHSDPHTGNINLMNACGTASTAFTEVLLKQITSVASQGREPDEANINFVLAAVNGVEPRDEIEAMLTVQMAAVHLASMTFARRLAHVQNIPQQDAAERAFNKLTRTFTTQMEALKRYRSTGQQTVRVERVTVEAGGQAVVGAVNVPPPGGGGGSP